MIFPACDLDPQQDELPNHGELTLAVDATDAQLRAILANHLERIESKEYGWDKPNVLQTFDHNVREMAKLGIISFATRDEYLARFKRATGFGVDRNVRRRVYAGTHIRPGGSATADAYSDRRGAGARVDTRGEAEGVATAPVPGTVHWLRIQVYQHGGENWSEAFRYVAKTRPEDITVETSTDARGPARATAHADHELVVAMAESLPGGAASASARVRPNPGVLLADVGPPRDIVQLCNDLPVAARVFLAVAPEGGGSGRRVSVGPWNVAAGRCVRWFPKRGLDGRDVYFYAESDQWEEDGRMVSRSWRDGSESFCTARELERTGLVRWFAEAEPRSGSCDSALAERRFHALERGEPRFHPFGDARGATIRLR